MLKTLIYFPPEHRNLTHEIRAVYTDKTIRVYQAYNKQIAEEAVRNGIFGNHFSMNRMTWIKPSFLWMINITEITEYVKELNKLRKEDIDITEELPHI